MKKTFVNKFSSESAAATEELAEQLGKQLKGGEIIELVGDVGAGKTTFVRGLARGTGSEDRVTSPTFTVSKIYSSNRVSLHHYDFYRLDDLKIIKNQLAEVTGNPKNIVVLEWADEVQDALSSEHMRVRIKVSGNESRTLDFSIPENYKHARIKQ